MMALMSRDSISNVDLNLLHVLLVVLETRSATRAAARLHVTQSAVSSALRRARALFGDALFTREAHGLAPTTRGAALLTPLRAWIDEAERLLRDAPRFDPRTTTRTFTVACADAIAVALLQPLVRRLRAQAPGARLRLMTLERLIADESLARGECDLLVGVPPVVPDDHRSEVVYRDALACIVRARRRDVGRRLDVATFAALPHAELALFGAPDDTLDRALAAHGLTREVRYAVPHFSSLPLVVAETDAVATLGRRVAEAFARRHPLRVVDHPLALPPMTIRQVWHQRADDDPGVAFLRAQVRAAADDDASPRRRVAPRAVAPRRRG